MLGLTQAACFVQQLEELPTITLWVFAFAFKRQLTNEIPSEFTALLGVTKHHAEAGDTHRELKVLRAFGELLSGIYDWCFDELAPIAIRCFVAKLYGHQLLA